MTRTGFRVVTALTVGCLCGCGSSPISSEFVATKGFQKNSRSPAEIEIFMLGNPPDRPHDIVGSISTDWTWKGLVASRQKVVQALRAEASSRGLDGVRDIHFVPPGVVGEGLASGTGFVWRR